MWSIFLLVHNINNDNIQTPLWCDQVFHSLSKAFIRKVGDFKSDSAGEKSDFSKCVAATSAACYWHYISINLRPTAEMIVAYWFGLNGLSWCAFFKLFFIIQWETSELPRSHKDNIMEELCVKRRELNFNYFYLSKLREKFLSVCFQIIFLFLASIKGQLYALL